MNLEAVQSHPLFPQLTPKQQLFIVSYVRHQDRYEAINDAGYDSKNKQTADMLARKMLKHPIIKQLIAIGLGYEPTVGVLSKTELLLLMSDQMRQCKNTGDFFRIASLFADLKKWTATSTVPDMSTLVKNMEAKRREDFAKARARRENKC